MVIDDVPLAQFKKSRYGQKDFVTPLSDLEAAAISLTELQHVFPVKGPIHQFLTSPFLGRNLDGKHLPGFPFAPVGFDDQKVFQVSFQSELSSEVLLKLSDQPSPTSMECTRCLFQLLWLNLNRAPQQLL